MDVGLATDVCTCVHDVRSYTWLCTECGTAVLHGVHYILYTVCVAVYLVEVL